jgi:UDP-N-acetylmuramyl tripeptide synthase
MLRTIAEETSEQILINREDPRLLAIARSLPKDKVSFFGLAEHLRAKFPSDDDLRGLPTSGEKPPKATSVLETINGQRATIALDGKKFTATLKLEGVYNIFNAVAAVALVKAIVGDATDSAKLVSTLESITPAFGRGEKLMVDGQPHELVLVKNPGGFRLGLSSFDADGYATMIAINDNYADGRDMSWLWDVEFESLAPNVSHVTGVRAYDMALRLQYDEIEVAKVEPDIPRALKDFIKTNQQLPKRIYCSYTSMLALRRELSKLTEVEVVS